MYNEINFILLLKYFYKNICKNKKLHQFRTILLD